MYVGPGLRRIGRGPLHGLSNRVLSINSKTKHRPTSTEALSSNSKLQGLVISLEVLIGTEEREVFKAALEKRRMDAKEAKKAPRMFDLSKEIENVTTVQTKYMQKIKEKLGKADAKPFTRGKGDAALLQVGKDMEKRIAVQVEERKDTKQGASAAWLLQLGMGNLLDYFVSRSVSIALFPTFMSTEELMSDFLAQVQVPFAHVEDNLYAGLKRQKSSKDVYAARRIKSLMKSNASFSRLDPRTVMLVSSDDSLLKAARDNGMLTCKFRLPNSLRGVSTHFTATDAIEIQDALEELNGIAMRGSAHASRSLR